MQKTEQQGSIANFNMALASLQRMDILLREANLYSKIGNLANWKAVLDALNREADPYHTNDERKEVEDIQKETDNLSVKYLYQVTKRSGHISPKLASQFYKALDEMEKKLRRLMRKHGLMIPDADDPSKAVFNR